MAHKDVSCRVEGPLDLYGEYANSFRVSSDGTEILLDFCVYSEKEERARVVSRVRIPHDFLSVIHQKIGSSLRVGESSGGVSALFLMPKSDEIL